MCKNRHIFLRLLIGLFILIGSSPASGVMAAAAASSIHAPHEQSDADDTEAMRIRIDEIKSIEPTVSDHFRQDDGVWDLASDGEIDRFYQASTLHIAMNVAQTVSWSMSTLEAGNFYLEVDAFHADGSLNNELGVIFRHIDDENFYLFGASSDGYYTLQMMEEGEWSDLHNWTESEIIETGNGSGNKLGVLADGPQISILINDELLATVEDETFDAGQIGLVAGTFDDAEVEVAFDDLFLWSLDEATNEPMPESTPLAPDETPTTDAVDLEERLDNIRSTEIWLSDDFRNETGDWPVSDDETVAFFYDNRAYHIQVMAENWLGYAFHQQLETEETPNFLVEVDTAHIDGPVDAEYGLLFHFVDGDNFHLYAISGQGAYSLWKKEDAQWTSLVDWTEDININAGEEAENHLGLLVDGVEVLLMVNGEVLEQIEMEESFTGAIGLLAGSFDDPGVEIAFDNFDLWILPASDDAPDRITTNNLESLVPVNVSARVEEIKTDEPTFSDDFRRENDAWRTERNEDTIYSFNARTYRIEVLSEGWLGWSFNSELNELAPADFLAEVDISHVDGPLDGETGLIFRFIDERNFYFFAVTSDGYYTLQKEVDGEWFNIVDWAMSDLLATGEEASNRIGVLAEAAQLTLLINGEAVAQIEDEEFTAGSIGLAAGTFEEGGLTIAFDNLDVWVQSSAPSRQELIIPDPSDIEQRLSTIRENEPIFSDDFRRNNNRWTAPDFEDVTFGYRGGAYRIGVNAPNITPGSTGDVTVADFLFEVDAAQLSGPTGQYGVFFRQLDDDNFYLFAVSPFQTFSLWKYVDTEWTSLIEWTESDAILAAEGEVNRVGVLAEGVQLTLLVNDIAVAQIEDDTFHEGMIALAAGTFDDAEIEVAFDNVDLWSLEVTE